MATDSPSTAALSAAAAAALVPFLACDDILALSCSARWLLDCYRTKCKKLVLGLKDGSSSSSSSSSDTGSSSSSKRALDAAVASLLTRQASLSILRVSDASALTGVARAFMPPDLHTYTKYQCGSLLTTLVLEELGTNASGWFAMGRVLAAGALPVLERLEVRESCLPDVRLVPLLNALGSKGLIKKEEKKKEGLSLGEVEEEEEEGEEKEKKEEEKGDEDKVLVCPALKHLKLGARMGGNSLQALAAALEARQVGRRGGYQHHHHHHHHHHQHKRGGKEGGGGLHTLVLSIGQNFTSPEKCVGLVARIVRACRSTVRELTMEGFGPLSEGVARGLSKEENEDEDVDDSSRTKSDSSDHDQKKEQQQLFHTAASASPTANATAPYLHRLHLTLVLFEAREHATGALSLLHVLTQHQELHQPETAAASAAATPTIAAAVPALRNLELGSLLLRGEPWQALLRGVVGTHLTDSTHTLPSSFPPSLPPLATLRVLKVTSAGLTTQDMQAWAAAMESQPSAWHKITKIDLSGNRKIGCEGLVALARGFRIGALRGLEELLLERTCKGDEGAVALFEAMVGKAGEEEGGRCRLKVLSLNGCGLGQPAMDGWSQCLWEKFNNSNSSNSSSSSSSVSTTSISSPVEVSSSSYLDFPASLQHLSLAKNPLGEAGSTILMSVLESGIPLKTVAMKREEEKGPAAAAAADSQEAFLRLRRLDLYSVYAGSRGVMSLVWLLVRDIYPAGGRTTKALPALKYVDVSNQKPQLSQAVQKSLKSTLAERGIEGCL